MAQDSIKMTPVWDILPCDGRRVGTRELMEALKIQNVRELYRQIQIERTAGLPILGFRSDGGGFGRPRSREEILQQYRRCRRIAGVEFAKMRTLRRFLNQTPGQKVLDFSEV